MYRSVFSLILASSIGSGPLIKRIILFRIQNGSGFIKTLELTEKLSAEWITRKLLSLTVLVAAQRV